MIDDPSPYANINGALSGEDETYVVSARARGTVEEAGGETREFGPDTDPYALVTIQPSKENARKRFEWMADTEDLDLLEEPTVELAEEVFEDGS